MSDLTILDALPPHLFALSSEAETAVDKETSEQKRREEFDAPDDCEVWLTFGTLRKIERVLATINCIRALSPRPAVRDAALEEAAKEADAFVAFADNVPNNVCVHRLTASDIAYAIRALKSSPPAVRDVTLREALEAFLAKYDLCEPAINDAFAFRQNHGLTYRGPTYEKELADLRAALSHPSLPDGESNQ